MWSAAVAAYAVAVFQRGSLGVAAIQAHHHLHASAAEISLFVVLQLAVYAGMQVPVGALVMAAGQACLALADGVGLAIVARVLVGGGDAMCFISVLRLIGAWFPSHQVPLLTQLTALVGQLGQVAAAYPLVALLGAADWRNTFLLCAGIACAGAVLVVTTVHDHPPDEEPTLVTLSRTQLATHVAESWRERGTKLGLWAHFTTGFSGNTFALLWGYPFLVTGEGLSKGAAGALLTLLVAVNVSVGPVVGRLTGGYPFRRSNLVIAIVAATIAVWTAVLAWPGRTPLWLLLVLIVVLGSNGPGSMVGIDFARTFNPRARAGSASGIVNMGAFVASLAVIAGIGAVLSGFGVGPSSASIGQFKVAFCVQYAVWALGLVWFFRHRGTLRADLAAEGQVLDPLHRAAMRRWRGRSTARR